MCVLDVCLVLVLSVRPVLHVHNSLAISSLENRGPVALIIVVYLEHVFCWFDCVLVSFPPGDKDWSVVLEFHGSFTCC